MSNSKLRAENVRAALVKNDRVDALMWTMDYDATKASELAGKLAGLDNSAFRAHCEWVLSKHASIDEANGTTDTKPPAEESLSYWKTKAKSLQAQLIRVLTTQTPPDPEPVTVKLLQKTNPQTVQASVAKYMAQVFDLGEDDLLE